LATQAASRMPSAVASFQIPLYKYPVGRNPGRAPSGGMTRALIGPMWVWASNGLSHGPRPKGWRKSGERVARSGMAGFRGELCWRPGPTNAISGKTGASPCWSALHFYAFLALAAQLISRRVRVSTVWSPWPPGSVSPTNGRTRMIRCQCSCPRVCSIAMFARVVGRDTRFIEGR
jgi:hypothetical protein